MVAAKVLQGSSEHGDAGDVPEAARWWIHLVDTFLHFSYLFPLEFLFKSSPLSLRVGGLDRGPPVELWSRWLLPARLGRMHWEATLVPKLFLADSAQIQDGPNMSE